MRAVLLAMLTALGIGLMAPASAPAAPASGLSIAQLAEADLLTEVRIIGRTRRVCVRWIVRRIHLRNTRWIPRRVCVRWRHV